MNRFCDEFITEAVNPHYNDLCFLKNPSITAHTHNLDFSISVLYLSVFVLPESCAQASKPKTGSIVTEKSWRSSPVCCSVKRGCLCTSCLMSPWNTTITGNTANKRNKQRSHLLRLSCVIFSFLSNFGFSHVWHQRCWKLFSTMLCAL